MPEGFEKLKDKFLDFWKKLDKNQKSRFVISTALFLAAIIFIISYSTRKDYVTVFTVTNPRDIIAVEQSLTEKKIHFKHGANSSILVDRKDKNMAEFAIAAVPGLSSTVSIEDTWNNIRLSSTESDKQHLWQDFKRTSLIAKLKMFDNVIDADVDLSIPQQTMIFSSQPSQRPTAFVRINSRGEISSTQVQGIASVVAASIGGMEPGDVTVVDNNFNPLNVVDRDPVMGAVNSQYEMRQREKENMENSVRRLYLGKSDSYDYLNVVANPVLDFDREAQLESEIRRPTDMEEAIISRSDLQEIVTNENPNGLPGIDGNPGVVQNNIEGDGVEPGYQKTTSTINFDYNRVQTEREKAIGKVDYGRSSLSIALWYGDRVIDDEKINDAFIAQLRADVASATGVPPARISVNKYRMAAEPLIEPKGSEVIKELLDAYGLFVLLLLMVVAFMVAVPKNKVVKGKDQPQLAMASGIDRVVDDDMLLELDGKSEVLRQIEHFVKDKPDSVANLLRNWLQSDYD
jgi:flagellar M-ring protein FliF